MTVMSEENYLKHYGILRKSGRYPWGSGGTVASRSRRFIDEIHRLRKEEGMKDSEIAKGFGMSMNDLRASLSIATNELRQQKINQVERLADKGMSNSAIGRRLGLNESSVRALRAPGAKDKADQLRSIADMLKRQVEEKEFVDVGLGVEKALPLGNNPAALIGVPKDKLATAVAMLRQEGYTLHTVKKRQLGTGEMTTFKVLAKPGVTQRQVWENSDKIKTITEFSEDRGRSMLGLHEPLSISSKRIAVVWDEDGGAKSDGVIYVRPGVKDVSIGAARYAQVRVKVDGTHYLKGMAIYKDDLPPGVDIMLHTNKPRSNNKLDAMKPLKEDEDNPFGAVVRQRIEKDPKTGKEVVTSAMNKVGSKEGQYEEGGWDVWSRNLPSQMLSKQSPELAKAQLDLTYERRRSDLEEIKSLLNPSVKQRLLKSFSDDADSAAVHLRAANLPRQATKVLLPVPSLKDHEVYAPSFKNGERVALVRFPHGGTFEIPELTVNNRHPAARSLLRNTEDAIGINHKVAERLSGADFDGDTVLVIPNRQGAIKSTPALEGLKNFDPHRAYPAYDGMKTIDGGTYNAKTKQVEKKKGAHNRKQQLMGDVSNLITDMTIKGANTQELARAVRHSMVIIDAEKHVLDYKSSAQANGIPALKERYQGRKNAGAKTLISRAKAPLFVPHRTPRPAREGGPIDKETGKKVFVPTGRTRRDKHGNVVEKKIKSRRLAETDDARTLIEGAGTRMEHLYADHSNRLKAMANEARKEMVHVKAIPYNESSKRTYSKEVESLDAKLNNALRNAPLERQAQVIADSTVKQKKRDNPDLEQEDIRKIERQALHEARRRTGAAKQDIDITPEEWNAIQAGAITKTKLDAILQRTDEKTVRQLATPKTKKLMTSTKTARAQGMLAAGYTQAEVAEALGVSLTTLKDSLSGGGE